MTQKEKIEINKDIIEKLYCVEGRNKSYISRLLEIDRKTLTNYINNQDWEQAKVKRLCKSTEKFYKEHKLQILKLLTQEKTIHYIAGQLGVDDAVIKTIINFDEELQIAHENFKHISIIETKRKDLAFEDLPEEEWKLINDIRFINKPYYISNMGRCKVYLSEYKCFRLLKGQKNKKSGYWYIRGPLGARAIHRLVAKYFVNGQSDITNTVNHIDMNKDNNKASNLEWVSQAKNNQEAFYGGRKASIAYGKHGKFKSITLDNTYEFKTIRALAKFLKISESHLQRLLNNETNTTHKFKFNY